MTSQTKTKRESSADRRAANSITVSIPTFNRNQVLIDTLTQLLRIEAHAKEICVIDQTPSHESATETQLDTWQSHRAIRWLRLPRPSTVVAMNTGLVEASCPLVLFLDDDIIPSDDLVRGHLAAHAAHPEAWAVVGQILQPGQEPQDLTYTCRSQGLASYLDFPFHSSCGQWVENVMAGNLSVRKDKALALGGFDENFPPPVAYRFETEFARRLIASGGKIWFEPSASIRHLRAPSGGTRSQGSHLTSVSPVHGVGDYYYALRCGRGWDRVRYVAQRPWREVRTKFHLRYPWWIPVKLLGELRAFLWALKLVREKPRLMENT